MHICENITQTYVNFYSRGNGLIFSHFDENRKGKEKKEKKEEKKKRKEEKEEEKTKEKS